MMKEILPLNKFYKIENINIIQEKSLSLSDWDSWGVRDIAPVSDEYGNFIEDNEKIAFVYTGSSMQSRGLFQQSGLAFFCKNTNKVTRFKDNPIFKIKDIKWSKKIAATPWLVKLNTEGKNEKYKIFFRAAIEQYKSECICSCTSNSMYEFKKENFKKEIGSKEFFGLNQDPSLMGVINYCRIDNHKVLLLFEGIEKYFEQKGQIFAAISEDNGLTFKPFNNGDPFFSARMIKTWPVKGVCNPRLIKLNDGWFMLGFNGTYLGEYSLGIVFTKNFKEWYEYPHNPLLIPKSWPPDDKFSYRLEGPCFNRNDFVTGEKKFNFFFMSIPLNGENHENSVNATAELKETKIKKHDKLYHFFPCFRKDLKFVNDNILFNKNYIKDKFLQINRISKRNFNKVSFNLENKLLQDKAMFFFQLSNTFTSLPLGIGFLIMINKNGVFFKSDHIKTYKSISNEIFFNFKILLFKVLRKLLTIFRYKNYDNFVLENGWVILSKKFNLQNIQSLPIQFIYDKKSKFIYLYINSEIVLKSHTSRELFFRILSFSTARSTIKLKNVKIS